MNNIATINELNLYNNQRKSYIEFDTRLKQMDFNDDQALDQAVQDIQDFIQHMTGLKLHSIAPMNKYIINHHQMERAIAQGLQCYGMQGATDFDNENLATTMLNAPIRDYRHHYFIAPQYHRLANLSTDHGQAVKDFWNAVLRGLVAFYGKSKKMA